MELAQNIVGVAAKQLRENSMAEACTLSVVVGYPDPEGPPPEEYEQEHLFAVTHTIAATPMCQHVLLQYKGMSLKLPRVDKAAWEETGGFLYTAIKDGFETKFKDDYKDNYRRPYNLPERYEFALDITAKDTEVLAVKVESWEELEAKLHKCMMPMRHVAALQ
jgi:hypothetical protein